jgi:hypothetical protein
VIASLIFVGSGGWSMLRIFWQDICRAMARTGTGRVIGLCPLVWSLPTAYVSAPDGDERRAKIVAAEGEYQAAVKLGEAADIIAQHPVALQLRTLQTMAEISIEKNSTIIFPAQFMPTVQEAIATLSRDAAQR